MADGRRTLRPLVIAGITLGIGFGGFVDGIILHQVLQWHHMLTSHGDYPATTVAGLETNTLWDGFFHVFAWLMVFAGVWLLWGAARNPRAGWSAFSFAGALAAGWGLFNLIEGVVNHHILGIHHVRDDIDGPLVWDLGFLAFGVALVLGGAGLIRLGMNRNGRGPSTPSA